MTKAVEATVLSPTPYDDPHYDQQHQAESFSLPFLATMVATFLLCSVLVLVGLTCGLGRKR